ncbi:MAG TPA: cation diffusion facilitator family transporter [Gemmatimonadales bacterium]|jgi:cobalt-zinc-cadmium efflux system protein|nr:cation diffusion facilitator family transporter [Gemmatimonadales bacterium]
MSEPTLSQRSLECAHRTPLLASHARTLKLVLGLTALFMIVEAGAGWVANSLALLADAGHMFADVAALGLALFVAWAARRPATAERTYGYLRLEILAALVNGAALLVLAGGIVWEAAQRFRQPPVVEPRILFGVGFAGLLVNVVALRLLHRGHQHSLNVRGAYLHVLGDLLGSVGAMAAGAIILVTGWTPADPLISIVIAVLIVWSGARLARDSVEILLEATPRHISLSEVERRIVGIPGVSDVHDLHVWTLTSGVVAMSGHAVVGDPGANQRVLETVQGEMAGLGINHVTMQLERDDTCADAGAKR